MSTSKEIDVRKQIGIFVEKNPDMKVSEMVRVLGLFGIKRSTAYTWINCPTNQANREILGYSTAGLLAGWLNGLGTGSLLSQKFTQFTNWLWVRV
jgi:hypothetical protein